jgi:hypothetical protein
MHDLHNNIVVRRVIVPQAIGTTGATNGKLGKIIDRQGFDGVEFVYSVGSITATNAVVTPVVLEGDVTGTMTSVADNNLVGTEAAQAVGQAATRTSGVSKNVASKIGYKGIKRYVQLRLWSTVTAAPVVSAEALLFNPDVSAVTNAQAVAQ